MVALVDASDQHHRSCVSALRSIRGPLGTVWPALTEAMYLLLDLPKGQDAVWEMFERRAIRLLALDQDDVPRIRELMGKYADRPMDLADAALVRVAERDGLDTIFTVDRKDCEVYRMHGRRRFRILGGPIDRPRPAARRPAGRERR
jgi:predicted nucleic acid-binding protein